MGNSYGKALSQWSKGEYPYANTGIKTRQDDVSKIASVVGYRTDDAGASSSQAPLLRGTVAGGLALVDTLHTIDTTGGALSLEVRPAAVNGNVDFQARLLSGTGTPLAISDPLGRGTATLTATLAAGTYFVEIKPIGYVDPATSLGYSTYGSLGAYQVIGSFPGTTLAAPISTPPTAMITAPARATDRAGNVGTSAPVALTVTR